MFSIQNSILFLFFLFSFNSRQSIKIKIHFKSHHHPRLWMESYVWSLFVLEAPPEWQWPLPARQRIREAHLEEEAPRKIHLDRRGFLHNFRYYQQQYCHAFKPDFVYFIFSIKKYPVTVEFLVSFFLGVLLEKKTIRLVSLHFSGR